jgi:hypothetical protein
MSVDDFYEDFFQNIVSSADVDGAFLEDSFFDLFCDYLVEAGELETADRSVYIRPMGGVRVDGYGGDPLDSEGVLSLVISDFNQSPNVVRLTQTEMDSIFKRLENFLNKSLDYKFRNGLEETSPGFGLADMIAVRWANIVKVRLFLISNRLLSDKIVGRESDEFEGRQIVYSVWDIGRLSRLATSGRGREEVVINLAAEHGGPIALLPAHLPEAGYEAYLAVFPAAKLASIYDRWSTRLLEQNVRVFLQAKGGVNKGIRNTIDNEPEMFFAYNNGITATAEAVDTLVVDGVLQLVCVRNLQIVNGGQTTASIHAAYLKKTDLSKVFVQMKLSIVDQECSNDVVPRISEYANSQNKVNAADFFANHPFHVRIEDFSRRIFSPSSDGSFRETKWFYERARGQYQDARARLSTSQRKKFDNEFPKSHLFSKTDLAKFLAVWRGSPEIVCKGAQKNFAHFAGAMGKEWDRQPDDINESFYRHAISKAIVFRRTERLVTEQPWYQGGYRAQVVAYTIAKLANDVEARSKFVDFDGVWRAQKISDAMIEALTVVSSRVHSVITDPISGVSNITEWAKHQACWARVKALKIDLPAVFIAELIDRDEEKDQKRSAVKDQRMLNGIEAQARVVKLGATFWRGILDWGLERSLLSEFERDILRVAASIPHKLPSEKQSIKAVEILGRLKVEGLKLEG